MISLTAPARQKNSESRVHSDEKNEKTTYVTLYGIEQSHQAVEQYSHQAVELLEKLPGSNSFLEDLIEYLINRTK